jgi:23S rRNA pseudouridine1911/1915/1917 synthase
MNDLNDEATFLIPNEADYNKRIDMFIAERVGITRSASQKLIDSFNVSVNGKVIGKSYRINKNDAIECEIPEPVNYDAKPEDIPLNIVYEDESFIIVNK